MTRAPYARLASPEQRLAVVEFPRLQSPGFSSFRPEELRSQEERTELVLLEQVVVPAKVGAILEFVQATRGVDPSGLCPVKLSGRVQRRFEASGLSISDYLRFMAEVSEEVDAVVALLGVDSPQFFPDSMALDYVSQFVLPAITANEEIVEGRKMCIWSTGCANGEEPYSMAMLLNEFIRESTFGGDANVEATDRDVQALAQAQGGIYSATSLVNVPRRFRRTAFMHDGDHFRILPDVASRVRFSRHDMLDTLTTTPVGYGPGAVDLIVCRNLLIYLQPDYQEFICENLHGALTGGGYLLLGPYEELPPVWWGAFERVTDRCNLYRKRQG